MITWGDVIDITLYTFDLHKTDLSMLLECNSSKISKIRSGTQGLDRISKDRNTLLLLSLFTAINCCYLNSLSSS